MLEIPKRFFKTFVELDFEGEVFQGYLLNENKDFVLLKNGIKKEYDFDKDKYIFKYIPDILMRKDMINTIMFNYNNHLNDNIKKFKINELNKIEA